MSQAGFSRLIRAVHPSHASSRVLSSLVLMWGVMLFFSTARADFDRRLWKEYLTHATGCATSLSRTVSQGTRCLFGNGLELMLDEGLRVADTYGKTALGQHFQVVGRLAHAPVPDELAILGDIDMVLPLGGAEAPFGRRDGSALFFQHGMTRSWDDRGSGLFRNDLRQGVVRRFRISNAPDADILGVSAFHLFNTEHGHRVVVPGVEYISRWGAGSLRYFLPTTRWRAGDPGQEERALGGLEVEMRLDLSTTLRLNSVGYRWQAEDGSNGWDTGGRMELDWRPHPWLNFGAGYDGIGQGRSTATFHAVLHLPLDGERQPDWQGLGVVHDESPPSAEDLWRPVDGIGPIRVGIRDAANLAGAASVRFLQETVSSGDTVRLEVTLPTAVAPEDVCVLVRLVPGSGANPAVAGEDFIDQPVETTIRKGTTSSTVSFTLLRNHGMTDNRSLGAMVSAVP